jgi:hypothetical protein
MDLHHGISIFSDSRSRRRPLYSSKPSSRSVEPSDPGRPSPDLESFDLHDDSNGEMAGSLGRQVEAQLEDTGVHFEAGTSGALVDPQYPSGGLLIRIYPRILPRAFIITISTWIQFQVLLIPIMSL